MKNVHVLEVELESNEWSKILDESFKKAQKDVKVDGFRKGAVPKDIYIKKFGVESLYMDAVDKALPVAYRKVMESNNLIPVCEPKVDIKHICDDCVEFTFTIITKPELTLGKYKGLKTKKEEAKVTEEEIDIEIKNLREKMAEVVEKTEGIVKEGDTAVIDFEGFVDDKPLDGGSGKDYPLEIGSNTFIPGFETGIVGMKVNETKELNLKFPENYVEELKNKDVLFKVTLKSIKERILPEINKELFLDLGYEDIKEEKDFRTKIKEELIARKNIDLENKYVDALLEEASSNMKIEVNEEITNEEIDRMIKQYEEQLKYQGLTLEQYFEFTKSSLEDLKKNMQEEALKRVKYRFMLDEISIKEKLEVSDEEADAKATEMAESYNMGKDEFLSMFGGLDMMKYDLKMRQAIEILKN